MEYLNHIVRLKDNEGETYFILEDGAFSIRSDDPADLEEWEDYFRTETSRWAEILEEFERFAEDEETQKFLMHTFLTQIVYETPSIMEEEEWETILRYKNKLGM